MLSLVIPFYNDVGCPIPFVGELKKEFKGIEYELILVDDCSTDKTLEELNSLKAKNVRVIHNEQNRDYGGAVMEGFKKAKGDILGFTCGDGEVTPEDVARVYKEMKNYDIIKAVRTNREDGLNREFISKVFNLLSWWRFKLKIKDINGYPVYFKKEVYQGLTNIRTDWIFNIDLLRKITSRGYKIENVLVTHKKRFKGKSHMTPLRITKMVINYLKYK